MIRYIWRVTEGFRGRMAVTTSFGIARVGIGLLFVALSKQAVDIATGEADGNLILCVAGLIGALVAELVCSAIVSRTTELSEADMKNKLQEKLFGRLMTTTWTGTERFHTGDSLSRLTDDSRVAAECLCRTIPTVTINVAQLLGAFIFLWYFSPLLALVLVAVLPIFLIAGKVFFRKIRELTRRIREVESGLQEKMQESLQHRILIVACRHTRRTIEAVGALHRTRHDLIKKRVNITVYSRTAVMAGFGSGYLAAFIWGVNGLYKGTITFGIMTAYLQLAGQIQRPLAELARLVPGLIQSHASFSRLAEIEALPVEDEEEDTDSFGPAGISLSNVTFSYPGSERPVLSHFTHTFAPGSKTAVMGETGVGKSTLLRLILGLIRPAEGEVEIFSESRAVSRRGIVYVPQGNSLLSGTIRQNLLMAKPNATEEELRAALHDAAADFVFSLRDGLDTVCGESGDGLSEGQAQRIAIARALLMPGPILLLDEISAALDEETERLLMERLAERTGSRTVIYVTHRPAILSYCDSVLRLGNP